MSFAIGLKPLNSKRTRCEYKSFYKGEDTNENHIGRKENLGWCNNFKGFKQYRYLIESVLNQFKDNE